MHYAHALGLDKTLRLFAGRPEALVDVTDAVAGISCLDDLIRAPLSARSRVAEAASAAGTVTHRIEELDLRSPILHPSKVVCVGLNYHDHAEEQGVSLPSAPMIFAKFPSAINHPGAPLTWDPGLTTQVDLEVELAVIVGSRLSHATSEQVQAGIFGYTVANDVSARDLQASDGQFVRAKSLDSFLPMGPTAVTADEFGDPTHQRLWSRINDRLMQESSLAQLIFPVVDLLSELSRSFRFEPGDVLLTGTPAGVGAFRTPPVFLQPGDVVEVGVEGIGALTNAVATPDRRA
jgi:2-keto-4-pentenoate hydratase/2-oxohepta-3-ene-1,7-dioic acid hydratase in catechol pathway